MCLSTFICFLTKHRLKLFSKILAHLLETFLVFGVLFEPICIHILLLELVPVRVLVPMFRPLFSLPSLKSLICFFGRLSHLFLQILKLFLHLSLIKRTKWTLLTLLFLPFLICFAPSLILLLLLFFLILPTLLAASFLLVLLLPIGRRTILARFRLWSRIILTCHKHSIIVIFLSFFFISQHLVSIVDLLEFVLLHATCPIGMVLVTQLVVHVFYFLVRGCLRKIQHFVVVDFGVEIKGFRLLATTPEMPLLGWKFKAKNHLLWVRMI